MPYYPPSQSIFSIRSENNPDGYITISGDGYISNGSIYIDIINVTTTSDDWDLYLCSSSEFSLSDASTVKIVSNGIGDTVVPIGLPYSSELNYIYLYYSDNAGSATCSLYISGRTL